MKTFACGDIVPGCRASFASDTEEELLAQVAAHAAQDHDIAQVSPALAEQVLLHVQHVPPPSGRAAH